MRENKC